MLNQNNMGVHLDKAQFKAAIEFTAAKTGFQPELIEKDYICSLILNDFDRHLQDILIFKGGTLLAKAYAGFYRLSEDLDFTISVASSATRQERRRLISSIKPFVHSSGVHPVLCALVHLTQYDDGDNGVHSFLLNRP